MSSTPKSTKKQEHENFFRRKSLREHITSQPEDPDLVCLYIDLNKHLLSQVITSIENLGKELKKNPEVVWDWFFKLISTYDYYTIDYNKLGKRL